MLLEFYGKFHHRCVAEWSKVQALAWLAPPMWWVRIPHCGVSCFCLVIFLWPACNFQSILMLQQGWPNKLLFTVYVQYRLWYAVPVRHTHSTREPHLQYLEGTSGVPVRHTYSTWRAHLEYLRGTLAVPRGHIWSTCEAHL